MSFTSFSKHMQQDTFAYKHKEQFRYVENIWPPHVVKVFFQLLTFIKHILLHNV